MSDPRRPQRITRDPDNLVVNAVQQGDTRVVISMDVWAKSHDARWAIGSLEAPTGPPE